MGFLNMFPCLCHSNIWVSGGMAPVIVNLDCGCQTVVSFAHRPFYRRDRPVPVE
jgi:hypothetical protein